MARKSRWEWSIIVVNSMDIEQLASIIGVVLVFLQPDRKIVLVEAFRDEFRITACESSVHICPSLAVLGAHRMED